MDFWNTYKARIAGDFSHSPISLETAMRKNASLKAVSEFSREIEINKAFFQRYDAARRYIIAKDLSHDLLFSAYDVNSRDILVARITRQISKQGWMKIFSILRKVKVPNLEFRLMGLQNEGYKASLVGFDQLHKRIGGVLAEVDLFGTDIRNIAIDTKTGMTYDILMLNRIYRAGELANQVTRDDFESRLGELSFV